MENQLNLNSKGINYNLYHGNLNEISLESKIVINTINQYSYCIAREDAEFRSALTSSDILLPDGEGVVLAERFLTGKKIKKISGTDLHLYLLSTLNAQAGSCFYLGSCEETLVKIKDKLLNEYPNLKVGFYSPPFTATFSSEDNEKMIAAINDFNPDALFIGLTAPKQEKWSQQFKNQINAKFICSIGAVFDFYAETVKRPSKFMVDNKLEWMGRLVSNPSRMWRRYLYYGPIYVFQILKLRFFIPFRNSA
ncbi:WecB/TagA/CpsF family glycosyltransferase [Pedobacter mendelii]|uniref:Beta-1,4-N-acetyl- mannosaminyltransferase n=1 Tax=Pedobacter mendelii TaxID=1908240 RepID=A0ABQ2BKN1_9SPHI|nr:WecB/TagA/CpsF family glycosyltransferase [Pedobacter mendelii]GGI26905.1 beta-1,4-N-acetyl- mannosaminyltransferase [Pedobacter mendelii]